MRRSILIAGLMLVLHGCTPAVISIPSHLHALQKAIDKTITWPVERVLVTAYARGCCQCDFRTTSTGTVPTVGTAAVDPSVFPFGTRFIIPGYGYAVARDTGGAVIGRHVDIVESSCEKAVNWGLRHTLVKYQIPGNN